MQNEGRKIMHLPELKVSCTCVRVPVVRSHSVSIVGVHPCAHRVQPDGAVHGAGVHIDITEVFRQRLGQTGFTGPGRAIDCNRDHQKNFLPL